MSIVLFFYYFVRQYEEAGTAVWIFCSRESDRVFVIGMGKIILKARTLSQAPLLTRNSSLCSAADTLNNHGYGLRSWALTWCFDVVRSK